MSPYAKYFEEEAGYKAIEEDYGFILYYISGTECLITDFFVDPSLRGQGYGQKLANKVAEIAKANGCKHLTGNITLDPNRPEVNTRKTRIYIEYGFKLQRAFNNGANTSIIIIKEL